MRKLLVLLFIFVVFHTYGQEVDRIQNIKNNLELLAMDNSELNENLKLEINVTNVTLPNFLIAVSKVHRLNLTVAPDIATISIVNNFSNVTVADLLVFLCKEYDLTIDFTGNILSIKKYTPAVELPTEKVVVINQNPNTGTLSMDLRNDPLEKVFRKIMDISGENLLFTNDMANIPLTLYLKDIPMDMALDKMATMNNLSHTVSKDGFHLFRKRNEDRGRSRMDDGMRGDFGNRLGYKIVDTLQTLLNVDFKEIPIAAIVNELGYDLDLDIYTAAPLEQAGKVTFNAKGILFDDLLHHIFEGRGTGAAPAQNTSATNSSNAQNFSQNNKGQAPQNTPIRFTFKKEGNIYFFGNSDQLSVRNTEVIQMMYRSVELLGDPSMRGSNRSSGRTNNSNVNFYGTNGSNGLGSPNGSIGNSNRRPVNNTSQGFDTYTDGAEAIVSILPDEIKSDLDIRVDYELNSFFVSGPSANINRFKSFIKKIDQPVPVVLIEVMIIEVKKSATVETGISWGIGDAPVNTQGKLFPETDVTLGAKTVNKIIGGFDGFGSFNVGKVIPEFFANIKAMEANGNIKIRSSPKLSTLNGHRANLSIGETTYYVVTNQNFFGSQIPTTSEIRNYEPIDAELATSIKPLVSGNGQVTLDINVIQSDFNGERIENDAPPGLTSREFSSIIRMQNQDLAVLGGLEEKVKNDSGNGVPVLARIPVIKWLFSKRKREDTKQKLTILIKPTVIY